MRPAGGDVMYCKKVEDSEVKCCCTELANRRNWPILPYCLRRLANIGHIDQYLPKLTNITAYLEFLEFL
jgi:hypothetical protein